MRAELSSSKVEHDCNIWQSAETRRAPQPETSLRGPRYLTKLETLGSDTSDTSESDVSVHRGLTGSRQSVVHERAAKKRQVLTSRHERGRRASPAALRRAEEPLQLGVYHSADGVLALFIVFLIHSRTHSFTQLNSHIRVSCCMTLCSEVLVWWTSSDVTLQDPAQHAGSLSKPFWPSQLLFRSSSTASPYQLCHVGDTDHALRAGSFPLDPADVELLD